jgi:hypothetical protein
VSVDRFNYEYDCCPSEPWPVVLYTVTLARASTFYLFLQIIPGILVTFLSFSVFWAPSGASDAMSFGVAIIIVTILSNVVLLDIIPICGELLWIDIFSVLNTLFCCISLLQSALSIMVENQEGEHAIPKWMARLALWVAATCYKKKGNPSEDGAGMLGMAADADVQESVAGILFRRTEAGKAHTLTRPVALPPSAVAKDSYGLNDGTDTLAKRHIYFEKLFYMLDADNSQYIDTEECNLLFSFAMLDMSVQDRLDIFNSYDFLQDGKLTRMEFCQLCCDHMSHMSIEMLDLSVQNMELAREGRRKRNVAYWSAVSASLDSWARVIVPAVYILLLAILFNTEFSDEYLTRADASMYAGIGPTKFTTRGVLFVIIYSVAVLVSFIGYFTMKKFEKDAKMKKMEAQERIARRAQNGPSQPAQAENPMAA